MKKVNLLLVVITALLSLAPIHAQDEAPREDLDYRAIRRAATGREHAEMKTPRGTIFYKVKIISVRNDNISIEHQDGRSTLEIDSIPPEWVKEFNIVSKEKARSTPRATVASAPEFDLTGTVIISGDTHSGAGILVKIEDAYFVYTDCAIISGNKKISIKTKGGQALQLAKVIECAENFPLARIQVRAPGEGVNVIPIAKLGACADIKTHQFLYPLTIKDKSKAIKFKAATDAIIEFQYTIRDQDAGTAIMLGSKEAVGFLIGTMPSNLNLSSNQSQYRSAAIDTLRLDKTYTWKKVSLENYLLARQRIIDYGKYSQLLEAISNCQLQAGKIPISGQTLELFKAHRKDTNVADIQKLSENLEKKKGPRVNEKMVQRKLDSIIDSAMRAGKKNTDAIPASAFSWYHRQFFNESIKSRKLTLSRMEKDD